MNFPIDLRDGKDASKAKREDGKRPRSSAVCAHLCLGSQELGKTCSGRGFVERAAAAPWRPCPCWVLCVNVRVSSHSYWPAVLAGHQADGDSVWELPAAALLPDAVQRCERRGLPGPRCALSHHQFPHLQVCFTSCAENRRGSPFQVSAQPDQPLPHLSRGSFLGLCFTACALCVLLLLTFNRPLRVSFNAVF